MGGAIWIKFKSSREKNRAMAYLSPLDGRLSAKTPSGREFGVYFEDVYGSEKTSLSIEYSLFFMNSSMAMVVASELAKRFSVTRIGSDYTGWWSDDNFKESSNVRELGQFKNWSDWLKSYTTEADLYYKFSSLELEEGEKAVREIFKSLDTAANVSASLVES